MPNTIGRNSTAITGSVRTRRFERPAQDDAPHAAGQVLHHQQRHAAEDHAHPERVGDQIRLEEAMRARSPT